MAQVRTLEADVSRREIRLIIERGELRIRSEELNKREQELKKAEDRKRKRDVEDEEERRTKR